MTDDKSNNKKHIAKLDREISKLSFMNMYRVLQPIFLSWPYDDFKCVSEINEARNLAAHNDIAKVLYKGRNPFNDVACLVEMYEDVVGFKQIIDKFFWHAIEKSPSTLRAYYLKYGDISVNNDAVEFVDKWYERMTESTIAETECTNGQK